MAMLHNVCHRPIYKKEVNFLNYLVPYGLNLVFGQTWNTYYYHHVKHHHVEDNGSLDLSSTAGYQRDSFPAFLHYFLRFFLFINVELTTYFVKKGLYDYALKTFFGELASLALFALATYFGDFRAGIVVFWVPWVLMRFFMMAANWGQHAFINGKQVWGKLFGV
jgi:fatty acid desaturase